MDEPHIAMCPSCAAEAGLDDDTAVVQAPDGFDGACAVCGGGLAGFFYRVPEASYIGMAPGAG